MSVAVKKYNPGFLTDDQIIASFCVRTAEFESLVESLRESDASSSPHSLVIGPRGSGKTHLLLRVTAEVRRDPALSGLFPIVFAEESYEVTTCGEFWLECLGRLAEQAPSQERDNLRLTYDELRTVTDDQALADRCVGSLLDFADRHETRLVLLVENLNMLFSDIDDPDVGWRLRQTLQTESRIILFGSATSRFDEIDNPEHALYDLFRVITLRPLDTAECKTLWQTVSRKPSTAQAVRPLEILTGGNPRLLTIIARFGAERSFRDLMENLLDLVDEHTEYFKSHLESLPPQERRVYLALARLWKPSSTRDIADLARLDTNVSSALLKRLVQRGAVTIEGGTSRRRQYYLTERLYNIYYLLRRGAHSDNLVHALIEFMLCLYSPSELVRIIDRIHAEMHAADVISVKVVEQVLEALLVQARSLAEKGESDEAIALYEQVIQRLEDGQRPLSDHQIVDVLTSKNILLFNIGRKQESIVVCDDIIGRFEERNDRHFVLQVAYALGTKGMALTDLGDLPGAVLTFDQALSTLSNLGGSVPRFMLPSILQSKGMALLQANQFEAAVNAFDRVVVLHAIDPDPPISVTLPLAITFKAVALDQMDQTISEREFSLLLKCLAEEGSLLPGSIEAMVPFIASTEPAKAIDILQVSPAEHILLPLITALQQELGQTPEVAKEVAEVAKDVVERLARARAKRGKTTVHDTAS